MHERRRARRIAARTLAFGAILGTCNRMNDWTIAQDWRAYTEQEHAVWDTLFARQVAMLGQRAAPAFLEGIDVLRLSKHGIPDFEELSQRLYDATRWVVVAVPG